MLNGGNENRVPRLPAKPQLVTLGRETFPGGSLGFNVFPAILEGRRRVETTFNQPLKSLWGGNSHIVAELRARDLSTVTVGEVLRRPEEEVSGFRKAAEIRERLGNYLQGLAVTPHARLIGAIFGKSQQSPIVAELEPELMLAVVDRLDTLYSGKERTILALRFGIDDGITRTPDEIGNIHGVNTKIIRQLKAKGLRRMRHPAKSRLLRGFLTVPEQSLARQEFNVVLEKDMPDIASHIDYGRLEESTRQEIYRNEVNLVGIFEGTAKLKAPLSDQARADIVREIGRAVERDRLKREELKREEDNIQRLLVQEQVATREKQRREQQNDHIKVVRETVDGALEQGITDPQEIQRFLASQGGQQRTLRVSPSSWIALAMIEYVLNHPEQAKS